MGRMWELTPVHRMVPFQPLFPVRISWGRDQKFLPDSIVFEAFIEDGICSQLKEAFNSSEVCSPLLPLCEFPIPYALGHFVSKTITGLGDRKCLTK